MNIDSFINTLVTSSERSISLFEVLLSVIAPFIISLIIVRSYSESDSVKSYSSDYLKSLIMFAIITSILTLIIGSNIARAFGLIGALSIIRFRTAVKQTLDSMYIFWALSVGMCCGVGFYIAALILSVFLYGLIKVVDLGQRKKKRDHNFICKLTVTKYDDVDDLEAKVRPFFGKVRLLNISYDSSQNSQILNFICSTKSLNKLNEVEQNILKIKEVESVEIYSDQASMFL